jgi:hypothetical protein
MPRGIEEIEWRDNVPKGHPKIARRFSAGNQPRNNQVPLGTTEVPHVPSRGRTSYLKPYLPRTINFAVAKLSNRSYALTTTT